MAMMADAASGTLTSAGTPPVTDMSTVTATTANGTILTLNSYLTGLTNGTTVKEVGVSYSFLADGTVSQTHP